MESLENNKIFGAVLGTLTLVMGLGFLSNGLVHPAKMKKPGYELPEPEVAVAGGAPAAAAAPAEPIAVRLAKADAKKGEVTAKKCISCHGFEKGAAKKVGPALWGTVNRGVGSVADFGYSASFKAAAGKGDKWSYEALDAFLANPKGAMPGTAMAFAGISKADERADLIAYIRGQADTPADLPK